MIELSAPAEVSKQSSHLLDGARVAEQIADRDWWQGSIFATSDFANGLPALDGSSHWIVVSQTCNLRNPSLEKVPSVELVAARPIDAIDKKYGRGLNPRVLHTKAYFGESEEQCYELQIERRCWIPRESLAVNVPSCGALKDLDGDLEGRFKEEMANWIARSYTRVELPDQFNEAIRKSKLGKVLEKISKLDDGVHGMFFEVSQYSDHDEDDEDDEDTDEIEPMSPSEVAESVAPWAVELTVVCYDNATREEIEKLLVKTSEEVHDVSLLSDGVSPTGAKCSVRQVASSYGLHLVGMQAVLDVAWRVPDLMRTLRFTNYDHLSGSDELSP